MKKVVALFLVGIFCFSPLWVSASDVPEFMNEVYRNYTADYTISLSIDNAGEIADFLKEVGLPDTVGNFLDIKALIETLSAVDTSVKVEADISEDFRKIKVSLTGESDQNIVFNRNYNLSSHSKFGVWMDVDMDARNFVVIFSTSLNEKYAVLDIARDLPEEVSSEIFNMYDKIFNSEFVDKFSKEMIGLAVKHADISMKGNTCTVKYDNAAFVSAVNDVYGYIEDYMKDIAPDMDEDMAVIPEIPNLDGIQLLGEDGIICTYVLSGSKIRNVSEKWDISVSLSDILAKFAQESWSYEFDGNIDVTLEMKADITKAGVTKPSVADVNDENSFSIAELFMTGYDEYGEYDEYDWEEPSVAWYVWGEMEKDTFDGERYYIPLRECIEQAYWECSEISYDNGAVTIKTDCGDSGKDINAFFVVGTDTALVNGIQYSDLGAFKLIEGKVYATIDFYEKCLGWHLEYFDKDLLNGYLSYEFYTLAYE